MFASEGFISNLSSCFLRCTAVVSGGTCQEVDPSNTKRQRDLALRLELTRYDGHFVSSESAAERTTRCVVDDVRRCCKNQPTLLANHAGFRAEDLSLDPLCRLCGCQFGKCGDAGRTRSLAHQPCPEPLEVQGCCRHKMLETRFCEPSVPRAPQSHRSNAL